MPGPKNAAGFFPRGVSCKQMSAAAIGRAGVVRVECLKALLCAAEITTPARHAVNDLASLAVATCRGEELRPLELVSKPD